ncbi:hypothetical protein [Microbacterium sp. W4I20]|nr:hypothetical protein [Microbacterium sp. W4I20]MDQ0726814.1 hypothetical protein [Microbacterium sp. W4I20]
MARLRHIKSGAIVQVADEKVERLGSEWEVVNDDKPAKKPVAKTDKE